MKPNGPMQSMCKFGLVYVLLGGMVVGVGCATTDQLEAHRTEVGKTLQTTREEQKAEIAKVKRDVQEEALNLHKELSKQIEKFRDELVQSQEMFETRAKSLSQMESDVQKLLTKLDALQGELYSIQESQLEGLKERKRLRIDLDTTYRTLQLVLQSETKYLQERLNVYHSTLDQMLNATSDKSPAKSEEVDSPYFLKVP